MSGCRIDAESVFGKEINKVWLEAEEAGGIYFISDTMIPKGLSTERFESALRERAHQHGAILTPKRDGWEVDFQQAA